MSLPDFNLLQLSSTILAAFVIIFVVKILTKPLRLVVKLAVHAASGFVLLWIVNLIGFSTPYTLLTALFCGILGIPGVVLLLLFQFI